MYEGDWDQRPESEDAEVAGLGRDVYDTGAIKALSAVIAAIDQGATVEDLREFCEKSIAVLQPKGEGGQ